MSEWTPVMYRCFLLNKTVSIPEQHWGVLLIGSQGVGKSQLASLLAGELKEILGRKVIVVCDEDKFEDTIVRWYNRNVKDFEWWRGLTFARLKKLENVIFVVEDMPSQTLSQPKRLALRKLFSTLARTKKIFVIATSQEPLDKLGVGSRNTFPFRVEMNGRAGDSFKYVICSGRYSTAEIDWTANSDATPEAAQPILEALQKGISDVKAKRVGRTIKAESKRQQAWRLFKAGKTNKEVSEILGIKPSVVRLYRHQLKEEEEWQKCRHYANAER